MIGLTRAAGIQAGEEATLVRLAALFGAIEAGRGFGEVGVDTLVVSRFGAGTLPYLFIGLGAASLVAALAYGAALGRVSRIPLLVGVLATAAGLLLVGRLAIASGLESVVPVLWLAVYASGTIAATISWTVAGSVFDARQAKRLFPLCTGAAIAGSFVGTLASGPVARAAGTELLVVIEAVLLASVTVLIVSLARAGAVRVPRTRPRGSIVADVRVGFDEVLRSPLLRLIGIAYVLFSILAFSVSYPFLRAASTTFHSEADLATAIGLLSAAVTATSFMVSLTLANRVYARFGVAGAALVLPVVYVAGFGLWLASFSFATAAIVRFAQQVSQRGLSNAAWSAFYNVVSGERRAQVLAFMDGVPGQLGIMLSGLLLIGAGRVFALDVVFWLGAGTAVALTGIVLAIRRRYAASLLRTLRSGLGEQVLEGGPGLSGMLEDRQVGEALAAALRAPEPGVRRIAATLLGRSTAPGADERLIGALEDPDAGVRGAALDALCARPTSVEAAGPIGRCLTDPAAPVRAAAIRALVRVGDGNASAIGPLIDDPSPIVRAAAAAALDGWTAADGPVRERARATLSALLASGQPTERVAGLEALGRVDGDHAEAPLTAALDDDEPQVRRAAATALAARPALAPGVPALLATGPPRAQDAALSALRRHGSEAEAEVSAWAERQIASAAAARSARLSLDPTATDGGAVAFLATVLAQRERRAEDRVLGALAVLGAPEAGGVIRRCLRVDDPETRAQAMEALDALGNRRLGGGIVALMEARPETDRQSRDALLGRLADDDDPWIRALARRATRDANGGAEMADTSRTLDELDMMMTLRRVPLFEGLEPEDLQRIAAVAVERLYPAGTAVVREGDLDNELVVIVNGAVRVVRIEPDGTERLVRRYGAGDHIGELAILRDQPRIATVIAEGGDDGVRGLVISGEALKAILRERPDAAMAMLATLADRISAQ